MGLYWFHEDRVRSGSALGKIRPIHPTVPVIPDKRGVSRKIWISGVVAATPMMRH
jgi:hypothetical protein